MRQFQNKLLSQKLVLFQIVLALRFCSKNLRCISWNKLQDRYRTADFYIVSVWGYHLKISVLQVNHRRSFHFKSKQTWEPLFTPVHNLLTKVYKKDRTKDRAIVELGLRSDHRCFFKLGSGSRCRSQYLMKHIF